MHLRPYQQLAVAAVEDHFTKFGTDLPPVVVMPTGSGKTPVIATLCRNWVREGKRVLVLAHVRELLQQAVEKLHVVDPALHVGVCCAGLGRKQTRTPIVVASVQTACRISKRFGPFDRVIIDEAHRVSAQDGTTYLALLNSQRQLNANIQLLGLTATPFRLDSGPICGPEQIFGAVCYEVGVRQLIDDGYLSPLVTRVGDASVDTSSIRINAGEFVQREAQAAMGRDDRVRAACAEIVAASVGRRGILIFCTGVEHAEKVVAELRNRHAVECGLVTGAMASGARDRVIGRFRKGDLRFLANVGVLTTGFDAPHVDLVALLRPTFSPGLYSQMVGRGFRLAPGKSDCVVLDFGGNIARHGPVDAVWADLPRHLDGDAPSKVCPDCGERVAAGYRRCPACGYEFVFLGNVHDDKPGDGSIVSDVDGPLLPHQYIVRDVKYQWYLPRDRGDGRKRRPCLKVSYCCEGDREFREWVCFEQPAKSFARLAAVQWWTLRAHLPVPATASDAVAIAHEGLLRAPARITVRYEAGSLFPRITNPLFARTPVLAAGGAQ